MSSSPNPSTCHDTDAFVTKMNKHRKKPPSAVSVAEGSASGDAVGRTSDSTSPTRTTTVPSSRTTSSDTTNNISLRPRTMFAMKGRGRTESEGAAYRPQWSKDGEGFVSSSSSTAATATATTTATTTSSTGPLSMKDAVLGGGDDHRNDRRKPKVLRYSKEELLALHCPTNELPAFVVETSVASEHSLPPVATLPFDYEEIYKQWALNRNRGRGRGRSNATAAGAGAVQGTRGHQDRGARGDEALDSATQQKDDGVLRQGHKERDSTWERGAKITETSSRGDCIWDEVLEPGTDSNEMAAEIFRREMDAMRDELQGPKVDPEEIKDDLDAFDKKLEDAAAAGQFDDSDAEETPWDDPTPDDQKATEGGNKLSDEHAANPSEPQSSGSHLLDALEPAADTQLVLEEKGSRLFSQVPAEESSAGPPSSCVEMADEWFYLDPQGLQRGPFKTAEMREWFEAGYFKPHLPIRFGQHGIFTALASQFVPGQIPFATLSTRVNSVGGIRMDPILSEQQRLLELQHEQQRQQQMMQLQQQQQQQRMLQLEQDEKIRIEMQRLEIARQQQQTQLYQQQQILRDQQEKQRQQQQQQQQQQQFFLHQQQNSWQLSQREGIMSALGLFGGNQANIASTDSFRTDGMESQFRSEYHTHHQMNTQNAPPVAQSAALVNDEAQRRTQAFWPNPAPELSGLETVTGLGLQSAQPKSPVAPDSTQLPESNRSAPISDAWARRQKVPEQSPPPSHDIHVEATHRAAQESRGNNNQTTAQHGQPGSALSATPTKKDVKSGGAQKNGKHVENDTVATDAWAIGTAPAAASSKSMSLKAIQQEEQRELLEKRNRDKGDTAHLAQMGAQLKMMLGVDSMAVTPINTPSVSVPQVTVAKSTATSTPVPTPSSPSPVRGPWGQPPAVVTSDKSKSMRDILAEEERLAQERAKANANAPVNSQWVNIVAGNKAAAVPKPSRSVLGPVPASVLKSRQQVRATNGALKQPPSKAENDASFWNFGAAQPAGKESVISVGSSNAFGSNSVSSEFMAWASKQLKTIDVDANVTLLEYCASVEDPGEVREYLAAYLGSTPRVSAFATEFIQRKKSQTSGKKSPGHQDTQQRASETDSSNRRGKRRP
uniref:GYF domain-containing protein n=1 Tax=Hyaloperonospora arabidopsidis (strain Emoy2) TaxID=559515 RepID=M4BMB4_HYAAE